MEDFTERIRERFLAKLSALARLRRARTRGAMRHLVEFHTEHKLLLMAYSQRYLRLLGKVVANHEKLAIEEVWERYGSLFAEALTRPRRDTANVNALMHALGYFSPGLSAREKSRFLELLGSYRQGKAPLSEATDVVRSWLARFDEPYLGKQVFFDPYQSERVEKTDSDKGRKNR